MKSGGWIMPVSLVKLFNRMQEGLLVAQVIELS